jgi:hypothetical protein
VIRVFDEPTRKVFHLEEDEEYESIAMKKNGDAPPAAIPVDVVWNV